MRTELQPILMNECSCKYLALGKRCDHRSKKFGKSSVPMPFHPAFHCILFTANGAGGAGALVRVKEATLRKPRINKAKPTFSQRRSF